MPRKDSLLRLHQNLMARRDALRKSLSDEIEDLRGRKGAGDEADAAFGAENHAVSSELAEMESKELRRVEQALEKIREGTYGICEDCEKKIPLARLNALPYTSMCVECQRKDELENSGAGGDAGDWNRVYDAERSQSDVNIRLSDIELDLSGSGR